MENIKHLSNGALLFIKNTLFLPRTLTLEIHSCSSVVSLHLLLFLHLTGIVFDAKMKQGMMICRDLTNSIANGSPYSWKLYCTGEATPFLSEKLMKASKLVIKWMRNGKKEEERVRSWFSNSPPP